MKPICIIPARSGSKRIKNKNIKKINGKPLIAIAIDIAKQSNIFQRIIVSTDSKQIAQIAINSGAEVPFIRSKKLSDDFTPTYKVLIDCINKIESKKVKFHFCLYPTSILIDKNDFLFGFDKIKKTNSDFLCPIKKFNHNPQRSLIIKNNNISFYLPKNQTKRSQDLSDLYYDTGSFYIYRTKALLQMSNRQILPKKSTYIVLKKKLIDVNYLQDLVLLKKIIN
jgi:pseudaminic acid cytidylyltransferase